jgi:phenylalanyl-tRNA synthetase beta chain
MEFVDAVYASKKPHDGAAYYYMHTLIAQLASDLGFALKLKPITEELDFPVTAPFDQTRSALVETDDGIFIGMIGELKQVVLKNFKLPQYTAAMTLDLNGLQKAYETPRVLYTPLSKFPSVSQDVSLKVAKDVVYGDVLLLAKNTIVKSESIDIKITLRDIYASKDSNEKTITLRVRATSHEKTLTDSEVSELLKQIGAAASEKFGAVVS